MPRCLLLAGLMLVLGCSGSESEREEAAMKAAVPNRLQADGSIKLSDADRAALDLAVQAVVEAELPDTAVRFGRVRPVIGGEFLVVSPVTGRIPTAPAVQLGATVNAGAPLLDIVPVLAAAERISVNVSGAEIEGQIEAAQGELATQQAALARARELARSKIVSEAKLQEAETAVGTTRARLEGLKRARGAQTSGEGKPIMLKAPGPGTVVTLNAQVGAVVQQGDLLARILKSGPRWIDVSVAPSEAPGDHYEVEVGGTWIAARLIAPGAVTDDDGTRHDRLEIGATESLQLVPGQIASVRVARGAPRGLVVPESAIVPGVSSDLAYVETVAGTYAARPVKIASRFGGRVRIAAGLQAGEKVVVKGAMSLFGETRRTELRHVE